MLKRWISAMCIASWTAITLTSCGSQPEPTIERTNPSPQAEAELDATEPDQPDVASLDWQDACVLTTQELTDLIQPIVESGWADMWTRAEYTEEESTSIDGAVRCMYDGERELAVAEITIAPLASGEAYEQRCAEWVDEGPWEHDTALVAICDPTIANGAVFTNDRGVAHVYLDDEYTANIWLLTVGLGAEIEPVMIDISRAVAERWQQ